MQKLINGIFIVAAVCIIFGTIAYAEKSSKEGDNYITGWLWGIITAFCVWALWHGFSTGLFWM